MKTKLMRLDRCGHHARTPVVVGLLAVGLILGFPSDACAVIDAAQASHNSAPDTGKPTAPEYSPGVAEVVKLVDAHVDTSVVKDFIASAPVAYRLSADEIVSLHQAGIPADIMTAMMQRGGEIRAKLGNPPVTVTAPQATVAAPTYVAPPQTPVVVSPPASQTIIFPQSYAESYYVDYPSYGYVGLGISYGWPYYGGRYCGPGYRYGWYGGSRYCAPGYRSYYRSPVYSGYSASVRFGGGGHFGGSTHFGGGAHFGGGGHSGGGFHRGR